MDLPTPFRSSSSAHLVRVMSHKGGRMSDINRRTFVTTGASFLATGASLMLLRAAEAARQDGAPVPSADGTAKGEHHHNMGEEMQRCIQLCHDCHARCISMISHCLTLGGQYATPAHIRLLMDCAQICTATADYMARESSFHDRTCSLCSEICRRCAESCEQVGRDDQMVKQCAELCRRCAGSCERMASKTAA
jgi:hypothetical protein